jgi:hypothetical protein
MVLQKTVARPARRARNWTYGNPPGFQNFFDGFPELFPVF